MNPKKVLHIIPGYGGGISSTVRNLVNSIDTHRVLIDVASFSKYSEDFCNEIQSKKGKLFTLTRINKTSLFRCIKEYCSILSKNGPYDAVHIHIIGYKGLYFSLLSRLCGIKRVILHAHVASDKDSEIWYNKLKMIGSRMITNIAADEFASCSKVASEYLFGKKIVKKHQVMHIPNSINVNKFSITLSSNEKAKMKEALKIEEDTLVIGHIGQFGYQKNHEFMVEIIKEMKKRSIQFKWLFIGVGKERERIEAEIDKNGCSDVVLFLGRREDVHRLLQIMDVTVLPSHFEGLPTVTVETQAAGIPTVISSKVTDEVNMQLGLVQTLPLEDGEDAWIDAILKMSKVKSPDKNILVNSMFNRGFTTEAAARLYESYIWNEIHHYTLGDEIRCEMF
ncbi:glycosyltransferase [Priestia megaterium]|uniref:glycosyltransferase n=1 Tax=Priestia megaterium TaxID=1404 RepID=UPI00112D73D1|nr:glycosyltransferase [Priestia megaterium]TPF15941.1 hypothetical protein CBE78_15270 [Priestia megaterium]TPF21732.1 hypothetical protein CBE79_02440 [Priestia megaterium]